MIGKLLKGRGMRGLLEYLLAAQDQKGETRPAVKLLGGSFAGTTARQIAQEFAVLRTLRPKLEVAVVHETLRLPPSAPEPSNEEWLEIARYWTASMGFEAWVAIAHGDGHIHIAASRILVDGSVVSDSNDWTLSERIVRDIEKKFSLGAIKSSHLLEPGRDWIQQKAPSQAQLAIGAKSSFPLPSDFVAATINTLLSKPLSVTDFVRGLEAAGIDVRPNIATTGRVNGLAYGIGGALITAKALGRSYTWLNLQRAGLTFDSERDLAALRAANERSLQKVDNRSDSEPKGVELPTNTSMLSFKAAAEYASKSAANFMEAAGSNLFMVALESSSTTAVAFVEYSELLSPVALPQILAHWVPGSPVKAETADSRIVIVTDLGPDQLHRLNDNGLEPFAVTEVAPQVFEACIRLLPPSEPAPPLRLQRQAADMVAKLVGGRAAESFFVPGFAHPTPKTSRRSPRIVTLRQGARVVARFGAELLQAAMKQLDVLRLRLQTPNRERQSAVAERDTILSRPTLHNMPRTDSSLGQLLKRARQRPASETVQHHAVIGPIPDVGEREQDDLFTGPD